MKCSKKQYVIATVILIILCLLFAALCIFLLVRETDSSKPSKGMTYDNQEMFFQISDTHLDIYYNASVTSENWQMCRNLQRSSGQTVINFSNKTAIYGRAGCDTSRDLLLSVAQQMNDLNKELPSPAKFILLSGKIELKIHLNYFKGRNFHWKKLLRFNAFFAKVSSAKYFTIFQPRKFIASKFSKSLNRESLFL